MPPRHGMSPSGTVKPATDFSCQWTVSKAKNQSKSQGSLENVGSEPITFLNSAMATFHVEPVGSRAGTASDMEPICEDGGDQRTKHLPGHTISHLGWVGSSGN